VNNLQKVLAVISTLAAVVTLATIAWAFMKYPTVQIEGIQFMSDEIPVLPFLGVYFTPATIIVIFGFLSWVSGLEAVRDHAPMLPPTLNRLLFVIFGLVAFVFSYEVLWNFVMWGAAHAIAPSVPVDFLYNNLDPSMTSKIDFAFVTKRDSLYVGISLYTMFFLHSTMKGGSSSDA
jgi:hypothetical protein